MTFQQSVQPVPTSANQCTLVASCMLFSGKILVTNQSIFTFPPSQNFVSMTKYRPALWFHALQRISQLFNYSLNHDYRNSCPRSRCLMPSEGYFFMPLTQKPPIIATLFFLPTIFVTLRKWCRIVYQNPVKSMWNAFRVRSKCVRSCPLFAYARNMLLSPLWRL